ncbi:SLOG family protein [Nocardia asiatica]|uniref:SLOG family protein n=1 Tax=Nocardia asiatica TaxID=209252 RepID=UPI0002F82280|nr:SLOG family protein [Nocardia asiatica]
MIDTFRLLITGSRHWPDENAVWESIAMAVAENLPDGGTVTVVHGGCPTGADHFAHTWFSLPICDPDYRVVEEVYLAEWRLFGKAAGMRRNAEMVALGADLVLAFPLPGARSLSRGTWDCVDRARIAGLRVEVVAPTDAPRVAGDELGLFEIGEVR